MKTNQGSLLVVDDDKHILEAMADYLRSHYTYSLTRPPLPDGAEPIADFLFTNKEGHCELFAAALTAMARSIGLTSRMVSGFLVSEYNERSAPCSIGR